MIRTIKIWQVSIVLTILALLAYQTGNVVASFITLGVFLTLPGYLLAKLIIPDIKERWTTATISIGLSLSLMLIGGLGLNSLYIFGYDRPISTLPIFVLLTSIIVLLTAVQFSKKIEIQFKQPKLRLEKVAVITVCTLLPLLAIGGAIRLNNGASNILTMILMAANAILFVWLVSRPKLHTVYAYAAFMIGLSILFDNSLRGWGITGHDIRHEFIVFQNVMDSGHWQAVTATGDPYNACLSITILPAILAKISFIQDVYIYKVVYQLLFASLLPTLYFMFKRFAPAPMAFLGVCAFMTFPTFTNDVSFLNRQEIALGFFFLILFVNFSKLKQNAKTMLTVIFLISLILSHYSTSYATIGLLLLSLGFFKLFSSKHSFNTKALPVLSITILLTALLCTFMWNAQVTQSTGNLTNTLKTTAASFFNKERDTSKGILSYIIRTPVTESPSVTFARYSEKNPGAVQIEPKQQIPITKLGSFIYSQLGINDATKLNNTFHDILAKTLETLVLAGIVVFVFKRRVYTGNINTCYLLSLSCACVVGLVLFTIFPQLSIDYDVTRLFQQSLSVLWFPSILFTTLIFSFFKKYKTTFSATLYAVLYLNLAGGYIPQVIGDFPPQLPLNNSGVYYDYFYGHKSDSIAASWLGTNRNTDRSIQVDTAANFPAVEFGFGAGLIQPNTGYQFNGYTASTKGVYRAILRGEFIEYKNTTATSNSNRVYSNNTANIYLHAKTNSQ